MSKWGFNLGPFHVDTGGKYRGGYGGFGGGGGGGYGDIPGYANPAPSYWAQRSRDNRMRIIAKNHDGWTPGFGGGGYGGYGGYGDSIVMRNNAGGGFAVRDPIGTGIGLFRGVRSLFDDDGDDRGSPRGHGPGRHGGQMSQQDIYDRDYAATEVRIQRQKEAEANNLASRQAKSDAEHDAAGTPREDLRAKAAAAGTTTAPAATAAPAPKHNPVGAAVDVGSDAFKALSPADQFSRLINAPEVKNKDGETLDAAARLDAALKIAVEAGQKIPRETSTDKAAIIAATLKYFQSTVAGGTPEEKAATANNYAALYAQLDDQGKAAIDSLKQAMIADAQRALPGVPQEEILKNLGAFDDKANGAGQAGGDFLKAIMEWITKLVKALEELSKEIRKDTQKTEAPPPPPPASGTTTGEAKQGTSAAPLTDEQIKSGVKSALEAQGYKDADEVIIAFEKQTGLKQDGKADAELLEKLKTLQLPQLPTPPANEMRMPEDVQAMFKQLPFTNNQAGWARAEQEAGIKNPDGIRDQESIEAIRKYAKAAGISAPAPADATPAPKPVSAVKPPQGQNTGVTPGG